MKDSVVVGHRPSRPWLAAALLVAVLPVAPGCFSLASEPVPGAAGAEAPGTLGAFDVTSPLLGVLSTTPTACVSGDHQHFLGGDFQDPASGLVVRLVVDPLEGPAARVFASADPFGRSVVLRRSDCAAFHFSLDSTGWRVNDIRDYRISLELDCVLADGTAVRGRISSTHCH